MSCVLYRLCLKKQEGKALGIHVALIDKSEIIQKMLSHCLYYHTVQVHRFDSFEDYLVKFKDKKPNLIFIDWEIKQNDRPLIFTAIEQIHSIPFVLLYRKGVENELLTLPENQVSYRLKKPLNPKEVRDVCSELIPELKNSVFHSFLKFPKSEEEKKQEKTQPTPPLKEKEVKKDHDVGKEENKTKSFIGSLIEKTGLFKMPSSEEIESAEEFSDSKESVQPSSKLKSPASSSFQTKTGLVSKESVQSSSDLKKPASPSFQASTGLTSVKPEKLKSNEQNIRTDESKTSSKETPRDKTKAKTTDFVDKKTSFKKQTLTQDIGVLAKQLKEVGSVTKGSIKESSFDPNSKILKKVDKINKEDIDIDEDTQNDLAPMAIKSSRPIDQKLESKNLTKQNIQKAFDKYKDSLEFQKMLEKALSEHAQEFIAKILKGQALNPILKQSLGDFKESSQFKELVEKEVSQYLQKQLPLLIKSIVENEIKKIIGD